MAKVIAQGTTFTFGAVLVGEIQSYGGMDGTPSEEDVTTLDSTAIEVRLGLQNHGDFTLECFHDLADAGQAAMLVARASRAVTPCVLTLSNGDRATFDAQVKTFPLSGNKDESNKASIALRITGDIAWT